MKISAIRNLLFAILGFATATPATAVHLDPGGRGQVLIYPYYTVNKGQQTLLSVTNTSTVGRMAQVTFHEGYNGREVLNFYIFLSPFDSWSGTVFSLRDAAIDSDGAAILSRDTSCTAPPFSELQTSINGTPYAAFSEFAYLVPDDGGPYTIDRTREGFISIISVADLSGGLATSILHGPNGVAPTGCAQVRNLVGTETGLGAPSGGLMGSVNIIDGGQGTILSARAEALSGFTGQMLLTSTRAPINLSMVNDGTGALATQATARVFDANGKVQDLTYPGPDPKSRRVDAVSAVLMADSLYNEYQVAPEIGGASDWVVTTPTKSFYTDPLYLDGAPENGIGIAPFGRIYSGPGAGYSPQGVLMTRIDRDGIRPLGSGCGIPGFACFDPDLKFQTSVLGLFQGNISPAVSPVLGSRLVTPARVIYSAGWASLNLNPAIEPHALLASQEGKVLRGLPIVGYWASNIVNRNVIDGVLANYAAAVRHASSVTCVKARGEDPCD